MTNERTNFDALSLTGSIPINLDLMAELGLNAAIIYGGLIERYRYSLEHGLPGDGWFCYTVDDMASYSLLTDHQQARAIQLLVERGLIQYKCKGIPCKRYFYMNDCPNTLKTILAEGEKKRHSTSKNNRYVRIKSGDYIGSSEKVEHRAVMELSIGRPLKKEEVVHHIDLNKRNNKLENLFLFPSCKEHSKCHATLNALKSKDDDVSELLKTGKVRFDKNKGIYVIGNTIC